MSVQVTPSAEAKIADALKHRGSGVGVRIGVKTTGCSGLAYVMEYVDAANADDVVIDLAESKVFIDPKSQIYLDQVVVDYVVEQFKEGFQFTNPKEKSRCGCGESFTV